MTKLEQAIETLKSLPATEQDILAKWILADTNPRDAYELSTDELVELELRLASTEETVSAETVFARLYSKYVQN
jgi:hypothetical protein